MCLMRSPPMRAFLLPAPLLLAAFAPAVRPPAADAAQPFDAIRFFDGRTEGQGVLKVVLRSATKIRVESRGRTETDGTLSVRQTVSHGDKPARIREWRIRELSPGRYVGTLSDASGPVVGAVAGNRLHLRFRMKGGLNADQWLTLAPGGRSAHNLMRVRKFGLTVASLDETIRKLY
jgi:hypothetical protein